MKRPAVVEVVDVLEAASRVRNPAAAERPLLVHVHEADDNALPMRQRTTRRGPDRDVARTDLRRPRTAPDHRP